LKEIRKNANIHASPGFIRESWLHCHPAQTEEQFMNLKLIVAIFVLAAAPAFAQTAPKPTKADAQKVVQMISTDKAKTALYCNLAKLQDEIAQADQQKDAKKIKAMDKKAAKIDQKIGPEYVKLMAGVAQMDMDAAEGKEISDVLDALEKLCPKK
jgi:hypothetical protein